MAVNRRNNWRPAAVLVALVLCGVVAAIHRHNEHAHSRDSLIGLVRDVAVLPAQTLSARAEHWLGGMGAILRGPRLARENAALRMRVSALTVQVRELSAADAENARLRALLGFQQRSPRRLLAAEVVALKPSAQSDTLVLSRGSANGVKLHAVVVDPNGALIGQVIDVSANSCTVLMLTDTDSSVGAQVKTAAKKPAIPLPAAGASVPASEVATPSPVTPPASGGDAPVAAPKAPAIGICRGKGAGEAYLTYLKLDSSVVPGDTVSTSGLGSTYPAGIPIGVVASVSSNPAESMTTAVVRPKADLDHLSDAFIMMRDSFTEGVGANR